MEMFSNSPFPSPPWGLCSYCGCWYMGVGHSCTPLFPPFSVGSLVLTEVGGTKHDSDKLRVDLLPVDVLEGVAKILTHGANKYGDRNWERGITYGRLYGAVLRHLFAFQRGEDIDPESGLPHIDHALCELMFLSAMTKRKPHLDDRPGQEKKA